MTGFASRSDYAKAFLDPILMVDDRIFIELTLINYFHSQLDSARSHSLFLRVSSMDYNSPGKIDFSGIASAVDTVFNIIKFCFSKKARMIENQKSEIERDIKKIERDLVFQELISKEIENLKRLDIDPKHIKKTDQAMKLAVIQFLDMINSNMLTDVTFEED